MKHKTLAVLCAVVLTAGMMTGCGQKTEDTKTESGSEKTVSDEMAEKAGFSDGTGEEASDKEEASDAKDTKEAVLDTSKELTGIHSCADQCEGLRRDPGRAGCRYRSCHSDQFCKTGSGGLL